MSRGGYFHLADFTMQVRSTIKFKVALNRITDVFQCLGHRRPLGMATWQCGATHRYALRMFQQCYIVLAFHLDGRLRLGVVCVNCKRAANRYHSLGRVCYVSNLLNESQKRSLKLRRCCRCVNSEDTCMAAPWPEKLSAFCQHYHLPALHQQIGLPRRTRNGEFTECPDMTTDPEYCLLCKHHD